jgi:type I restriction enzyme S subunit
MSHYKPYPVYKDSGVEWIGKVPEHWEVKPIKIIASCNDDSLPESIPSDTPIRYVDISAVSHDEGISGAEPMAFGDAPSRARRKAKVGDVVVSTVRTYLKAVASVDEAHADCVYSTGFAVLRARSGQLAPEFLKWLALNDLLIQAIESHSNGLSYPAINASELVNLKTVVPGLHEQRRIASVLDRETARIDALIAKKTEFIELLVKKRQALITHAVTKGLDPNVKMKDSGVEWIGEVPEHWDVKAFKRLASIRNGQDYKNVADPNGAYPVIGSGGEFARASSFMFNGESVLLGRKGTIDKPLYINGPFWAVDTMFYTIIADDAFPRFVYYSALNIPFGLYSTTTALPSMTGEDISSHLIPSPDLAEQEAIAAFLDRETARIDALIEKVQLSIDLLKKRRSALITAAVTGQIDLREST